jgi:hypothetical protein
MGLKHTYPGTFAEIYDRLREDAMAAGVCPRVMQGGSGGSSTRDLRACGRPLEPGSQWCRWHQR